MQPFRGTPVLEGAAARRFEKEARKAERERGTIVIPEETVKIVRRMVEEYRQTYCQ